MCFSVNEFLPNRKLQFIKMIIKNNVKQKISDISKTELSEMDGCSNKNQKVSPHLVLNFTIICGKKYRQYKMSLSVFLTLLLKEEKFNGITKLSLRLQTGGLQDTL